MASNSPSAPCPRSSESHQPTGAVELPLAATVAGEDHRRLELWISLTGRLEVGFGSECIDRTLRDLATLKGLPCPGLHEPESGCHKAPDPLPPGAAGGGQPGGASRRIGANCHGHEAAGGRGFGAGGRARQGISGNRPPFTHPINGCRFRPGAFPMRDFFPGFLPISGRDSAGAEAPLSPLEEMPDPQYPVFFRSSRI
jgi:hypothetical protein